MWPLYSCCCTMAWDHSRETFSASDLKRKRKKKQKFTIALPYIYIYIWYIYTYTHNIVCKYILYIVCIYLYTYIVFVSLWHIFWSMPECHWARPWRRDDLEYWRQLLTAPKLSGPELTLKLWKWGERADAERADSDHMDGLEHCPPPLNNRSPKLGWRPYISGALHWS